MIQHCTDKHVIHKGTVNYLGKTYKTDRFLYRHIYFKEAFCEMLNLLYLNPLKYLFVSNSHHRQCIFATSKTMTKCVEISRVFEFLPRLNKNNSFCFRT